MDQIQCDGGCGRTFQFVNDGSTDCMPPGAALGDGRWWCAACCQCEACGCEFCVPGECDCPPDCDHTVVETRRVTTYDTVVTYNPYWVDPYFIVF